MCVTSNEFDSDSIIFSIRFCNGPDSVELFVFHFRKATGHVAFRFGFCSTIFLHDFGTVPTVWYLLS